MRLVVFGVGGAGCRIADALRAHSERTDRGYVVAAVGFDTDREVLSAFPEGRRGFFGAAASGGEGLDGDREAAREAAEEDAAALLRTTDDVRATAADAFLFVAGLGGGTGGGAVPALAAELRRLYDRPIYGLGVLPADEEGDRALANAGAALPAVAGEVDSLLLFDNEAWLRPSEDAESARNRLDGEVARRFGALFAAGETGSEEAVAESVVDASEIVNTLAAGGAATVGYAEQPVETSGGSRFGLGLFGKKSSAEVDETESYSAVETTVRKAVRGKLTLGCDLGSVERGLLVTGGPPAWLNRDAVERGRDWLTEETGSVEIRGGDDPDPKADAVRALALLSGVGESERVRELRAAAEDSRVGDQ